MMKSLRRSKDLSITGANARWYDRNARRYRLQELEAYARKMAALLSPGASVLEIAPGPGYLSIALSQLGSYAVTGVELSPDFVAIAQRNAREAGSSVDFKQGNVADLPFGDDSFDGIVCTAAFKNFRDPVQALREMHRVLRPGGRAFIVDMNPDITSTQADAYVRDVMHMRGVQALFMRLTFKYFLRKGAYSKEAFAGLTKGWGQVEIKEDAICLEVYLRK